MLIVFNYFVLVMKYSNDVNWKKKKLNVNTEYYDDIESYS